MLQFFDRYPHHAAGVVVLDGVVDEVDEQLPHVPVVAVEDQAVSFQLHMDVVLLHPCLQNLEGILCCGAKLHRCPEFLRVFLDLGEPDDIVDEEEQPLALPLDHRAVFQHVLFPGDHAAPEHLAEALDGGQGGFQLMGHIGGKLLPHLLRFNAVGHIHQQHDRSENTAHLTGGFCPVLDWRSACRKS